MRLPSMSRPYRSSYREFRPGIDLPAWFQDDLKAIDSKLYLIWHPYRVMWDNLMNQYEGDAENPRFTIHREHGEENWGFVLTDGKGSPLPEFSWHVWRIAEPHGWSHIVKIEDKSSEYLSLLTSRLYIQARFRDTYGDFAWNKNIKEEQDEAHIKAQDAHQEMFDAVQDENKWLTRNAMDNMERGNTAPTNPTVGQIISYPGQKNRGTIVRPLEDDDVGLKGFEDL